MEVSSKKVTLVDVAVVLAVFGGFGFLILIKLKQKYPNTMDVLKSFFPGNMGMKIPDVPVQEKEVKKQTWIEHRATI